MKRYRIGMFVEVEAETSEQAAEVAFRFQHTYKRGDKYTIVHAREELGRPRMPILATITEIDKEEKS